MKRTIFFAFIISLLVFITTSEGVAGNSTGLENYIRQHQERMNPQIPSTEKISVKNYSAYGDVSLFNDFQMNDHAATDRFKHQYSSAIAISENRILVGWEDDRNGNFDFYGHVMSAGETSSGDDQLLISDDDFLSLTMLKFAAKSDGTIAAVWVDELGDLWLGIYDSTFAAIGDPIKVNDNLTANVISYPCAAFLTDGRLVVVWEDTRLGSAIYGQIYNATVEPIGDNFQISPDEVDKLYWSPQVAAGTNGQFAVIWEEIGSAGSNVYLLLYDADALPTGIAINAADLASQGEDQFGPALVGLGVNGYLAGWSDSRDDDQNIWGQLFDVNGNKSDANFQVSEGSDNHASDLSFGAISGGDILAVFTNLNLRSEIIGQAFDELGKIQGSNFTVSDPLVLGERFSPNSVFQDDGSMMVTFSDTRDGAINIYGQYLNSDFSLAGMNFKVSQGTAGAQQTDSKVARMAGSDFGVVWTDLRNDAGDIYYQHGDQFGLPVGANMKLNDDAGKSFQGEPSIGSSPSGRMITAWVDGRGEDGLAGVNIFAQRLDAGGNKAGANILVNDDAVGSAAMQAEPDCDISSSGRSVVVWRDTRNAGNDIFGQIFDPSGNPVGTNFQINEDTNSCYDPKISMIENEMFIVGWRIVVNARSYVKFQVYNPGGSPLGDNMLIPVDTSLNEQLDFDLAANPYFGIFALAWINQQNINTEIYGIMVGLDGVPQSPVKIISDLPNLGFEGVEVDMDGANNYAAAWSDMRTGIRQSYVGFVEAGTTVFPNQPISNTGTESRQQEPSITLNGRSWMCSWSDNRNSGHGYDIFANSNSYNPTSADDDQDLNLPKAFELSQNYPNPFNPVTHIDYALSNDADHLKFEVFNVLGQTVYAEEKTNLEAGYYTIEFNGEGLPSGIYLYRISTDDKVISRKMTLMK